MAFYEIKVVSPPERMRVNYAAMMQEQDKRSFRSWVGGHLLTLHKANELPAGTTRCDRDHFQSWHGDRMVDDEDEWIKDSSDGLYYQHTDCMNCYGSFVLAEDSERLYKRLSAKMWLSNSLGFDRESFSKAPEADPSLPLYLAQDHGGHHNEGSVVIKIDTTGEAYLGTPKFFFQGEELTIPPEINRLVEDVEQRAAERATAREIAFESDRKARNEKDLEEARSVFR